MIKNETNVKISRYCTCKGTSPKLSEGLKQVLLDTVEQHCSAQTRTGIGHLRRPPGVELIPCRQKPLRRTRTLHDPSQTQV
jgi:hypothetical protein